MVTVTVTVTVSSSTIGLVRMALYPSHPGTASVHNRTVKHAELNYAALPSEIDP
jgi:hypothetical protein